MPNDSHRHLFAKSFVASVVLNALMIAAGISGGAQGRSTLLTRFSDAVAAPPGIVVTRCCAPNQHNARAFFLSVVEVTGISILFYGLIAWLVLELLCWGKRVRLSGTAH